MHQQEKAMKTMHGVSLAVAGMVVGFCVANMRPTASAETIPKVVSTPRYQVSAWAYAGNPANPTPLLGCY
jgi:hypothetical protein